MTHRALVVLGGSPRFGQPIHVTRPIIPDERIMHERIDAVFRSRWITNNGPMVRDLEERLRVELGAGYCAVFCNGTVALQVALRSLDLSGEVITTPFTFPATVHAIEWNGLTPVFCDIDPETYNLDATRAAELVGERTSAILPVHVFGNPCDLDAVEGLASDKGLKVVYDAAHAFGSRHADRPIGSYGDLSVLSFHATKLFHTCEGGAVIGANPDDFEKIALLRNFGIADQETVIGVGLNGKMSELHAAVGLCVLDVLDGELLARAAIDGRYRSRLDGVPGISFQTFSAQSAHNYSYFTVEIDAETFGLTCDEIQLALRAEKVFTRRYFRPLCSQNESYRSLPSARPELLPNAHRLAERILCLPMYGDLALEDADGVVDLLLAIHERAAEVRMAIAKAGDEELPGR